MWAAIIAMAAAAAYGANSATRQGHRQMDLYNLRADAGMLDAASEREASVFRADAIRREATEVQSGARGGFAVSGIDVNQGTAQFVDREIRARAESDAVTELLYGERRAQAAERQAEFDLQAGQDARRTGRENAIGSILGGGGRVGAAGVAGGLWT